jgi:hypothetical protein
VCTYFHGTSDRTHRPHNTYQQTDVSSRAHSRGQARYMADTDTRQQTVDSRQQTADSR